MNKLIVLLLCLLPMLAIAETDYAPQYVTNINYTLEQPFGGEGTIRTLPQYINLVYQFALGIVGIIAVVLIMFGGLQWVQAAGNETAISSAKEIISSAVVGLAIALLSFVILSFINPQFTTSTLNIPKIPINADTSIIDLPKCDTGDFSGQTCTNAESNESVNCDDLTCGEVGLYQGEYCRGVACSDDPTLGTNTHCYRGPTDMNNYSCQTYFCGLYAQNCADSGYEEMPSAEISVESAYHECTCNYYEEAIPQNLGMPSLRQDDLTETQEYNFNEMCAEDAGSNADLALQIGANPESFNFTGNDSTAKTKGWNCGFDCAPNITLEEQEFITLTCLPNTL